MRAPEKKAVEFDMSGVSVMIAIPVNRDLPWQTAQSLVETIVELKDRGIDFDVQFVVGSSIVEMARTKVAHAFLKSNKTRLFMIDSDQSWKAKDFIRLLALSTKMHVVCGAYPAKREPPTFLLAPEDGDACSNEFGCVPIKGIGLGFTVVHRYVIAELAWKAELVKFPGEDSPVAHIFRCDVVDGDFRGEDMAFFADVRALGHKVYLDPSIQIGHIGGKEYRADIMKVMQQV